jgi:hypothetical protein
LAIYYQQKKGDGSGLGGQRNSKSFGQKMDYATSEGQVEKARGKHSIQGDLEKRTNQWESGMTKLEGQTV